MMCDATRLTILASTIPLLHLRIYFRLLVFVVCYYILLTTTNYFAHVEPDAGISVYANYRGTLEPWTKPQPSPH